MPEHPTPRLWFRQLLNHTSLLSLPQRVTIHLCLAPRHRRDEPVHHCMTRSAIVQATPHPYSLLRSTTHILQNHPSHSARLYLAKVIRTHSPMSRSPLGHLQYPYRTAELLLKLILQLMRRTRRIWRPDATVRPTFQQSLALVRLRMANPFQDRPQEM
jgi:hypothetical protein